MSEPPLHNITFAIINNKWKATWSEGEAIAMRDLKWYEWPYLKYLRARDYFKQGW